MVKSALASSLLLAAFAAVPAAAHPLVIASLSVDTVLPSPVGSNADLARAYRAHRARYDDASRQLGFSATEQAAIDRAFSNGRAQFVTVPRHLDAMSEYRHGRVQVLHDVVIPANEHGYVVAVNEPNAVLSAYVPSACGNLSYLRTPRPRVAAARVTAPRPHPLVADARVTAPAAVPAPPSYAAPEAAPYPVPVPVEVPVQVAVPVPVYVPYGVRVVVGPRYVAPRYIVRSRYVPEPRVVVRERFGYGYGPHVGYGYGYAPHAAYGYAPHGGYGHGYAPHAAYGYAPRSEGRYAPERGYGNGRSGR